MRRRRLRSLVTALVMVAIGLAIFDRLRFIVVINMPWWGLLLGGVALFLAVDYLVARATGAE